MNTENFNQSPGKRPIQFCRGQTHWLSKAEFESVKASGMFGEFYPDQPDHWEDLPERDTETEPRGLLMRARTDRAELGPYVEFLTLHPETQENAKARALQFLRGICSPPVPDKLTFGQRLRIARRAAGLSIEDAAYIFQRSPRQWKYWESDERTPPAESEVITQEKLMAGIAKAAAIIKRIDHEQTTKK